MDQDFPDSLASVSSQPIGEQLRQQREALGLTLEQVASKSRIPQRHLVKIEAGEFAGLPGRTYAVGFTRTYAKLIGIDAEQAVAAVRGELDAQDTTPRGRPSFEPGDPARVPSRLLGWLSVLAVVLVLTGLFFVFRPFFFPAAELPSLIEQQEAQQRAAAATRQGSGAPGAQQAAAQVRGPVVFTASEEAWVRFYTADDVLLEKVMAKGERYAVPGNATVLLRTGRPELLTITVAGRPVPKLAEEMRTISDVPVNAQALLGRGRTATAPGARSTTASRSPTT